MFASAVVTAPMVVLLVVMWREGRDGGGRVAYTAPPRPLHRARRAPSAHLLACDHARQRS